MPHFATKTFRAGAPLVAAVVGSMLLLPEVNPATSRGIAAVAGAIIYVTYLGLYKLRSRLGTMGSTAIIGLAWATVMLLLAAVPSTCPGSIEPGRCSIGEVSMWATTGAITPVLLLFIAAPATSAISLLMHIKTRFNS